MWSEMEYANKNNKTYMQVLEGYNRCFYACRSLKGYHYVTLLKSGKNPTAITTSTIWNNVNVIETKITIPEKQCLSHLP